METTNAPATGNRTPAYLRPAEAATYLAISKAFFWSLVKSGRIITVKISPRCTVVARDELDKFIAAAAGGAA